MNNDTNHKPALDFLESLDPEARARIVELSCRVPGLVDAWVERLYGDLYQRGKLSLRERFLVSAATLMAIGGLEMFLGYQCRLALRNGVTRDELLEVADQISVFRGFPASISSALVIDEVADSVEIESEQTLK